MSTDRRPPNRNGKRDIYDGFGNYDGYGYSRIIRGENSLTDRQYNVLIGAILLWGFGINALLVKFAGDYFASLPYWGVIIGYFISCFAGIAMSRFSSNPIVSFIGYNLVVLPVGVVLSIALNDYIDTSIIQQAMILTAFFAAAMILAAVVWPNFFLKLGRVLALSLLIVVIYELICLIFKLHEPTFVDWIVAIIFCGYIGFDWARAQETNHTADDAVDACVSLYLDIINLFLRILSILSNSKRRD